MNSASQSGGERSSDIGSVSCNLCDAVVAGSYQTCQLTYTAGFAGIDDTGSLKFVMRYATDAGVPQFHDPQAPNYTTATASNGAQLQLRYDTKDNQRPWGKTLHVKVLQGYLREGETIALTLGDKSGGSPGWRMQTFQEQSFEIRVLLDRYATYEYERLPVSPTFRIVAGQPVRLVAVAPTICPLGSDIAVRMRLEDAWGNPTAEPKTIIHSGFAEGIHTISVTDEETGLQAETNPIVVGSLDKFGRYWADLHGQSEETIGSNSIDDYFRFARDYAFVDACAHQGNDFQITDAFWKTIQETTSQFNESGRFVTFPGWEWSGNTGLGGDRNVLFREEGGIISRSSRALVSDEVSANSCSETVEELFDRLESCGRDVMMFAHVGGRFADLERHREGLETAVEVHSAWGTFEWMLDDAFRRGYRVAIIANSDGHKGRPGASHPGASTFGSYGGLTCILAEELTREKVWEAYQSRRVYATTGARIHLDVTASTPAAGSSRGAYAIPMGSIVDLEDIAVPTFHVQVEGTASIERIEFRNAMQVLKTVRPYSSGDLGNRVKVQWEGATVRGRGRQVVWDGGLRIIGSCIKDFETINFHNHEKRCTQLTSTRIVWESLTTGGLAGVILELDELQNARLIVDSRQTTFEATLAELGVEGQSVGLGGVGKKLSAFCLPPRGKRRSVSFDFQPSESDLHDGDNPLYVHVVQEDGHMAWSSPVYFVRK